MSFLEIFTIVASSATIFAFVVGIFSVWNGRMTRREVIQVIQETHRETQALIQRESEDARKILDGIVKILARIETRVGQPS